jgi:hypothetical protein
LEAISQYPISSIRVCEIQNIQHRKPGPTLPTLLITFENDPATEKARKRRSSRSGGLSLSVHPNSLLFRTHPDERYNIYHWQAKIQPQIRLNQEDYDTPVSPTSPTTGLFINPFSVRSNNERPLTRNSRIDLHHRASSNTYTSAKSIHSREPDPTSTLISPSPSLRSRSSNISSQASSFGRSQNYHTVLPIQQLPAELPSPTSPTGCDDQSILGWTSAQGRSSALSSHTRGSNSVSVASSPPAPRETILDRAFMMRYIPGSDRIPSEEDGGRLSSIARFEALMKEADERKKAKGAASSSRAARASRTNGWELEEENEISDDESVDGSDDGKDIEMKYEDAMDPLSLSVQEIPTPAQRALEYISGRTAPPPLSARQPYFTSPPIKSPPPQIPRSKTTSPSQVKRRERPTSLLLPSTSSQNQLCQNLEVPDPSSSANPKRRSSTSTKRLSFTEFAKRLSSSTSSLLLVQTNASSGSGASMSATASSRNSHLSSEGSFAENGYAADDIFNGCATPQRGLSQSRLSGTSREWSVGGQGTTTGSSNAMSRGERDVKPLVPPGLACGWRGSGLGVFGAAEAGFL